MSVLRSLTLVAASGFLLSACATHQTAKLDSAETLRQASSPVADHSGAIVGQTASVWGDDWTATNLYERAVASNPTVTNRFNLAAGYQSTGRPAQAAEIYRTLVRDGGHTWLTPLDKIANPTRRLARFNVAAESERRLASLTRVVALYVPAPAGQASAVGDFALAASGVSEPLTISDELARQRDAAAELGQAAALY